METIFFNIEDLERDLAWQFSQGYMTGDEYMTAWANLTLAVIGGKPKQRRCITSYYKKKVIS